MKSQPGRGRAAGLFAGVVTGLAMQGAMGFCQAPGPESFARAPSSPLEQWEAVDYLVRTGQAPLAVPYLQAFARSNPDDSVWIQIVQRHGMGSILRLQDHEATRSQVAGLLEKCTAALRRRATNPERIQQAIEHLQGTREEQAHALERLREAGPAAVGPILRELSATQQDQSNRHALTSSLGKLSRSAVPPLIAALDAPDRMLAADAADALGQLGDRRAVPFLVAAASRREAGAVGEAARRALGRLTGRTLETLSKTPIEILIDEAWRYHRHEVQFPAEEVELWSWGDGGPVSNVFPVAEAETLLGKRFASAALDLDPSSIPAQTALLSLGLDASARKSGALSLAKIDEDGTFAAALASGPVVLDRVLRTAVADGHGALAAATALALGRVTNQGTPSQSSSTDALVTGLGATDPEASLAAATALVNLAPEHAFIGSNRLIPTLARFVTAGPKPGAVVIDGNSGRGNQTAGVLGMLGYEATEVTSGEEGFERAAEHADVELICIDPVGLSGRWKVKDTLSNLRADARTSGIPVIVTAPLDTLESSRAHLSRYPRVAFLVTPVDDSLWKTQLGRELRRMGFEPATEEDRKERASHAVALLAQIAAMRGGPLAKQLTQAVPSLISALKDPALASQAARVLGSIGSTAGQQALADIVLDPGHEPATRLVAAEQLANNVQRHGASLTSSQERRLLEALDTDDEKPELRSALASIVGALRPGAEQSGRRLREAEPRATNTDGP